MGTDAYFSTLNGTNTTNTTNTPNTTNTTNTPNTTNTTPDLLRALLRSDYRRGIHQAGLHQI